MGLTFICTMINDLSLLSVELIQRTVVLENEEVFVKLRNSIRTTGSDLGVKMRKDKPVPQWFRLFYYNLSIYTVTTHEQAITENWEFLFECRAILGRVFQVDIAIESILRFWFTCKAFSHSHSCVKWPNYWCITLETLFPWRYCWAHAWHLDTTGQFGAFFRRSKVIINRPVAIDKYGHSLGEDVFLLWLFGFRWGLYAFHFSPRKNTIDLYLEYFVPSIGQLPVSYGCLSVQFQKLPELALLDW